MADRMFVSSLTIGSHLRTIYRKLGINSRVTLAAAAARHRVPKSAGAAGERSADRGSLH